MAWLAIVAGGAVLLVHLRGYGTLSRVMLWYAMHFGILGVSNTLYCGVSSSSYSITFAGEAFFLAEIDTTAKLESHSFVGCLNGSNIFSPKA